MKRDLPLHQVRHVPPGRRAAPEKPVSDYPAGFFTELMREHRFPPRFEARLGRPVEAWRAEHTPAMYVPDAAERNRQ